MEAISLGVDGNAAFSSVVDADEVSKFWLADVVCAGNLVSEEDNHPMDAFVWIIELLNGALFCWTVPYLTDGFSQKDDYQLSTFLKEAKISRPKGLYPPTLVCKQENRDAKHRFLLGVLCHIGSSSDWMQQSSAGCQTDIALGHVPQSVFGCVLRAGQSSRNLHRTQVGDFDKDMFSADFLESEVYGPSDFMMSPPAFVPSLYAMFLEAAYLRTEVPVMKETRLDTTSKLLADESSRLAVSAKYVML
jgi:hypothetical protein